MLDYNGTGFLLAIFILGFAIGNLRQWDSWIVRGQGLTLVVPLAGIVICWFLKNALSVPNPSPRMAALGAWAVFSWVLLLKMILMPSFGFVGFAIAMPGAMLLVALFVWVLPGLSVRFGGTGRWVRLLVILVIMADVVYGAWDHHTRLWEKTYPVGNGPNRILTYPGPWARICPGGPCLQGLHLAILENIPEEASFIALPEGVIFNFFTKRPHPSRYINFMPTEFIIYGQDAILADFIKTSPDYVVTVPKDTREFNLGVFGQNPEYGVRIMDWVEANYEPVWRSPCFSDLPPRYSMRILKRKPRTANGKDSVS